MRLTPFQAWTRRRPTVKHFRVLGYLAWAHILAYKHIATDLQRKTCIFVGYLNDVKGYKLLHSTTHEILIKSSVHFEKSSCSSYPPTSPSNIALETLHHDDDSLEVLDPSKLDKESSSSISDGDSDDEDTHYSPSHHSEVDDSPPDSLATTPLWTHQTFKSTSD